MQIREQAGRFLSRVNSGSMKNKGRRVLYQYGVGFLIGLFVVTLSVIPVFDKKTGLDVLQEFFDGDDVVVSVVTGDPPENPFENTSDLGYELLDNGSVFHMWNQYNSYYFNVSNGMQFTNHYEEYWTKNIFGIGYYDGDDWNKIKTADELSNFNKNISGETDDYINATLWKDLSYGSYDFRLAVRYCLGVNDSDLTVIPYIKNLGIKIPYTLGFGWEMKDIKIDNTVWNDQIRINGTSYLLNQTLDIRYTNITRTIYEYNETTNITTNYTVKNGEFYLQNLRNGRVNKHLYLKWNPNLDYLVWVKNRINQYNAPVTLFIKVGTLAQNQEKSTELHWFDSPEIVDSYSETNYDQDGDINDLHPTEGFGYSANAQSFTCGSTLKITSVKFYMKKIGSPTGIDGAVLYAHSGTYGTSSEPTGSALATSDNFDVEDLTTDYVLYTFTFTGAQQYEMQADTYYCIVYENPATGDIDSSNCPKVARDTSSPTHSGNRAYYSNGAWVVSSHDMCFYVYGEEVIPENNPPTIECFSPDNASTGNNLTGYCRIFANDTDEGDKVNITWRTNESNGYITIADNNTQDPGSFDLYFPDFNGGDSQYWWEILCDDGTDNVSKRFWYETALNMTERIISQDINGSYTSLIDEIIADTSINGSYTSLITQVIVDQIVNGSYTCLISEIIVDQTINGSYTTLITQIILDQTINGSYQVSLIYEQIIDTSINGSYVTIAISEKIVDQTINGSYTTLIDERIVSTAINGSYTTLNIERIISQDINGSYQVDIIEEQIIDQTINGSYVTIAISDQIVSQTINGSYTTLIDERIVSTVINGSYTTLNVEYIIDQTINGSYQVSLIYEQIIDTSINGSYVTIAISEKIVDQTINGSYTTLIDEHIISQTINGSYNTIPPVITSESITSGLTSGETATIRANVTDTSNIEAVWVIVNDTVGSTNYTMSQIGATDFYNASFEVGENGTGTWYYKVFASDIYGNINNTASWHSFIVSKPDATPTNEIYPTSASPLTLIRITADLEATDLLKSVNATLNISSGFSFTDTDTYPQNQSIGNFSASETKTAEWHVFTPLLEDIYTFNISWNDNYSNFWNGSDKNIEVSYDITNLSNSTFVNVICAVEIEAGDDFTAEIQIRDGLGNYVNADSLPEISLIDPLADVSVGPTTGGVANIETGRYSYTKSTAAGWMGGSWQMLADVTRNGYSFTDREFFKITSGPFDVRDISIIDNVVPALSISVVLENQGGAITDIYVVWELTRTDTDALLHSGSDTVAVAGSSTLTHTVSPSTSYEGEVKITFVGWYGSDFTEQAGAFETFTTVSEEEPAPSPPGAPGGPGGPGLPSLYSLTVICEDGGRIYGVLLQIVEDGADILSEYTDMDGEALFEIPKHATITIQASKTGYEKAEETITVHSDMTMTIYMQPIGIPFMFWILLIPILAVASHVVYKKYNKKR